MRTTCLLLITILAGYYARAQHTYWQQQVNYIIDVRLQDASHELEAFETITYINQSPDTLTYIWFHLWPNAYKNDRTAYSEQTVQQDNTAFYFSPDSARGYINQLAFRINDVPVRIEPDLQHVDIVKILLNKPLLPKEQLTITTPFHVKLPDLFSRSGHIGQNYFVTQWYPKPAVYDKDGWHPMPYLDQGEFYSEFGSYEVNITVPANYTIAATGNLADNDAVAALQSQAQLPVQQQAAYTFFTNYKQPRNGKKTSPEWIAPPSAATTKTLTFREDRVHDFAWFASKMFVVRHDTLQLAGRTVQVFSYFPPYLQGWDSVTWYTKRALAFYSRQLGKYPYNNMTVVATGQGTPGGMEYPGITLLSGKQKGRYLDQLVTHETGHNWFYGMLASNERRNSWMDEGMNTFYEQEYLRTYYGSQATFTTPTSGNGKTGQLEPLVLWSLSGIRKDLPATLPADSFPAINYWADVYVKPALLLRQLKDSLGEPAFDALMQDYFRQWQFKHPSPEDFFACIRRLNNRQAAVLATGLEQSSYQPPYTGPKKLKLTYGFNLSQTDRYHYLSVLPFVGYNRYDQLMPGLVLYNYQLPLPKFTFLLAPLYGTNSKTLTGAGRISMNWFGKTRQQRNYWLEAAAGITRFSANSFQPDNADKLFLRVNRIAPSLKLTLYNKDPRSKEQLSFKFTSFFLQEENLTFNNITTPAGTEQVVGKANTTTNINRLAIRWQNTRKLYPFEHNLQVEQHTDFVRAAFTADYFFNYAKGSNKGIEARVFAGKFFYLGSKSFIEKYYLSRYQFTLSAPSGPDDYTYSNYFIGRNAFDGWMSQQVMRRDGFFKVNTNLLGDQVGRSDDWLIAVNASGNLPDAINVFKIFPVELPVKLFADIGTYSGAWQNEFSSARFLYDAGVQVSLFKNVLNVYVPILYSGVYRDYYKSVFPDKRFAKTISFSIDIQRLKPATLIKEWPL
jgi:hypothetical protein